MVQVRHMDQAWVSGLQEKVVLALMLYDATNRKDIRRAEKAAALQAQQESDFIVSAMSTIPGRTWFHSLLSACHIFSDPFTGDALREAYSKGERNVGLRLYTQIVTHCPDSFVAMMREAAQKEQTDASRGTDPDSDFEPDGTESYAGRVWDT